MKEELEKKLKILFMESMKGNQASYEAFLGLCSTLLKPYFFHLGGKYVGQENVEDLLQEILITLHQKKHTYQVDRPILPWLYTIARHRYIDYYRSKKRIPESVSVDELEHTLTQSMEEQPYNIEDVMGLLTPKQKNLLTMIKLEGATYEEAATALSMNVSAVKVGVHRIIKSLKNKVNNEK